jgi:Mn-dependent DtxR family transcriptional regulator
MTKLVEFEGDMIRLTPEGEKLADDLNTGKITVDDYFDKTIQNMIDNGLIEKVGEDHYQLTPKGKDTYRALSGDLES